MHAPLEASSERLTLKSFDYALVNERYLSWLHDERVNRYLLKPNTDTTLDDVLAYVRGLVESPDNVFLAILDRKTGEHIGNVRLGPMDHESRVCQYSMMIGNADYHGRGVGTETVALAADICFRTLGFRKLFLDVIEENKAAVRIYEKNGFQTEGVLRAHKLLNGRLYDLRIMSLFNPAER